MNVLLCAFVFFSFYTILLFFIYLFFPHFISFNSMIVCGIAQLSLPLFFSSSAFTAWRRQMWALFMLFVHMYRILTVTVQLLCPQPGFLPVYTISTVYIIDSTNEKPREIYTDFQINDLKSEAALAKNTLHNFSHSLLQLLIM